MRIGRAQHVHAIVDAERHAIHHTAVGRLAAAVKLSHWVTGCAPRPAFWSAIFPLSSVVIDPNPKEERR